MVRWREVVVAHKLDGTFDFLDASACCTELVFFAVLVAACAQLLCFFFSKTVPGHCHTNGANFLAFWIL